MIVDTHVHVVSHDEERYPLSAVELPNGAWWRERGADVAELFATLDANEVDGSVLVQASGPYGSDNSYLLDAAAHDPSRSVAVCTLDVDPDADLGDDARDGLAAPARAAEQLHHLVTTSHVRGMRLFALAFDGGPGWIGDVRTAPVWEAAAALHVPLVATVFASQLGAVAAMMARFPEVTVCLDHAGFPPVDEMPLDVALEPLGALTELEHLVLKVSSHVLLAAPSPGDLMTALSHRFGTHRLMWGSDHPQTPGTDYRSLLALAVRATAGFAGDAQERFFGRTAARVWPELAGAAHPRSR